MIIYASIIDGGHRPGPPVVSSGAARIHTYHVTIRDDHGWRHTQALHLQILCLMAAAHRQLTSLGKSQDFLRE